MTSVVTQGSGSEWVTSYKVTWSVDATVWNMIYDNSNSEATFSANSDASSKVENPLPNGLIAKSVRVSPQSWQGSIAMKVDVYGCGVEGEQLFSTPSVHKYI